MSDKTYEVKLNDIFEGPMDLLVYLIKKNEVDIYDIPIAKITVQFLSYLEWMKKMNIDFVGDFLLMASTLAQVKSRMLLPDGPGDDEDEEDPRMEIARPLLEYMRIKSAAKQLGDRKLLGEETFARTAAPDDFFADQRDQMIKIGLFELIDAFQKILEKTSGERLIDFEFDRISVKDKIAEIIDILEVRTSAAFDEFFLKNCARNEIIITFLALLEMVKMGLLKISQHGQTGVIRLFYI